VFLLSADVFPDRDRTIKTLLETGRLAAVEANCAHPEDLAYAITSAIEHAAVALWVDHKFRVLA
jgi:TRAP-type uncharacterized transport system substrate-binding protein